MSLQSLGAMLDSKGYFTGTYNSFSKNMIPFKQDADLVKELLLLQKADNVEVMTLLSSYAVTAVDFKKWLQYNYGIQTIKEFADYSENKHIKVTSQIDIQHIRTMHTAWIEQLTGEMTFVKNLAQPFISEGIEYAIKHNSIQSDKFVATKEILLALNSWQEKHVTTLISLRHLSFIAVHDSHALSSSEKNKTWTDSEGVQRNYTNVRPDLMDILSNETQIDGNPNDDDLLEWFRILPTEDTANSLFSNLKLTNNERFVGPIATGDQFLNHADKFDNSPIAVFENIQLANEVGQQVSHAIIAMAHVSRKKIEFLATRTQRGGVVTYYGDYDANGFNMAYSFWNRMAEENADMSKVNIGYSIEQYLEHSAYGLIAKTTSLNNGVAEFFKDILAVKTVDVEQEALYDNYIEILR